jgi:hypothetical protein
MAEEEEGLGLGADSVNGGQWSWVFICPSDCNGMA